MSKRNANDPRLKTLFTLLLLAIATCVMASTPPDTKVTVNFKSAKVETVLREIQRQAKINVVYKADLAKEWPSITIRATKKPAAEVIETVTGLIGCDYEVHGNIVTITRKKPTYSLRTVQGYVRDEEGEALVGVPVCIGESRVCTVTDANGFYTFKIPTDKTILKFSYVGMDNVYAAIPAGSSTITRDILMTSSSEVDEVVVTGYQDIKRTRMTGSSVKVNARALEERYDPNVMQNLEGRVAGLSTYGGEMKVRGISSLYASTNPLLVVDGLPVESGIDDLNPYDIESIDVLKDAAATAIYGARATNGVVVVTTKSAKEKGKTQIDFSANLTVTNKPNLDYHDNHLMNPSEQVDAESQYYQWYFNNDEYSDPLSSASQVIAQGRPMSPIFYAYYQLVQGNITQGELDSQLAALKQNNYASDYKDNVLRQQVLQQYNISLRTMSDKSSQNLIVNFRHDNEGIRNAFQRRFNASYKGVFNLTKWLTANFGINAIFDNNRATGSQYTDPFRVPAYSSLYNSDGSTAYLMPLGMQGTGNMYASDEQNTHLLTMKYNPLDEIYNDVVNTSRQNIRLNAGLNFDIWKGLTATAQFVYETDRNTRHQYANADSYEARSIRNAYTMLNSDGSYSYLTGETAGAYNSLQVNGTHWTARGQLNYNRTFAGKHNVNAIAGLEFRETKYTGDQNLQLGYDDQLQSATTSTIDFATMAQTGTTSNVLYQGQYPAYQFAYSRYIQPGMTPYVETRHRYASGYFNAQYTYDERLMAFGSFRKDYADVYGLNAKFRGKPLWSVGAAWNIGNENFMRQSAPWLNALKLRYSYGVTGNIYQGATSYMTATTGSINTLTRLPYATIESPANPNLKWEKTVTNNVGLDFALWDNRISGSFDYYHKKGSDVFSYRTLELNKGFQTMFVNAADVVNKGIELALSAAWFRSNDPKGFSWNTNLSFTYNKNEVTKVENAATTAMERLSNPFVEGYPSSALWSFRFAGIGEYEGEQGKTLWYDENNEAQGDVSRSTPAVLEYSGQTDPKYILGLNNDFRFYGFRLGINMIYYGGHKMRVLAQEENSEYQRQGLGYGTYASYFLNSWTPENSSSTVPGFGQYGTSSPSYEAAYSNTSIYDAAFLKIRNIVFGYDFTGSWLQKVHIQRLGLSFQVNDPKPLWKANDVDIDPETLSVYTPTSYVFGINVTL